MTIRIFCKSFFVDKKFRDIYQVQSLVEIEDRYYFKCSDRKEEFYYTKDDVIGVPIIIE